MYGKIENGKFKPAPMKVSHEGNKTILEPLSAEELAAGNYKEVFTGAGTGHPGTGMKPSPSYEDKGTFILRRLNWVPAQQEQQEQQDSGSSDPQD
jgi:hypothetical protein